MSKSETTKKLEYLLRNKFDIRNDFFCFECTIGWYGKEIVDCVVYNTSREISCFEIKSSEQDFHSNASWSFFGNKNYFVMPLEVYEKVQKEIPMDIGVYVAIDRINIETKQILTKYGTNTQYSPNLIPGFKELYCIKKCKKRELKADKEVILSSMIRTLQNQRLNNKEYGILK